MERRADAQELSDPILIPRALPGERMWSCGKRGVKQRDEVNPVVQRGVCSGFNNVSTKQRSKLIHGFYP